MSELDTRHAAEVVVDYKRAVAAISAHFMDEHPELPAQVMTIGLMEVTMGLYRRMTGATRERFMSGADALWNAMDEVEGRHD